MLNFSISCIALPLSVRITTKITHWEQVSHYFNTPSTCRTGPVGQIKGIRLWKGNPSALENVHIEHGDMDMDGWLTKWIKFVLAFWIGDRKDQVEEVLKVLAVALAENSLTLLTSHQLPHYAQVILKIFGRLIQPERKGIRGCFPKMWLMPPLGKIEDLMVLQHFQKCKTLTLHL